MSMTRVQKRDTAFHSLWRSGGTSWKCMRKLQLNIMAGTVDKVIISSESIAYIVLDASERNQGHTVTRMQSKKLCFFY